MSNSVLMDLAATGSSALFGAMQGASSFSVQVTWDGDANGVFTVEATNEEVANGLPVGESPSFKSIGTAATAAGTPGTDLTFFVDKPAARYRVKYTRTSGTGKARISAAFGRTR